MICTNACIESTLYHIYSCLHFETTYSTMKATLSKLSDFDISIIVLKDLLVCCAVIFVFRYVISLTIVSFP